MSWWLPALKAVLPHVGSILDAAKPVFTRKTAEGPTESVQLLQQQVAELQAAVSQNAANVRELAAQLQGTVAAIEKAAVAADENLRRSLVFSIAALAIATLALFAAGIVLLLVRP